MPATESIASRLVRKGIAVLRVLVSVLRTLFKHVKVTFVILFDLAFAFIDKLGMYRLVTVEGAV